MLRNRSPSRRATRVWTPATQEASLETAIHEAAHAVAAVVMQRRLHNVTIVAAGDSDGMTTIFFLRKNATYDQAVAEIVVGLAGAVGPQIAFDDGRYLFDNAQDDLHKALTWILRHNLYLSECVNLTRDVLEAWWWCVERVAAVLLDEKTLSASDVRKLVYG